MRTRVLPYKQGSRSAKALSDELGAKVLRTNNSSFVPADDDVVINWGSTKLPDNLTSATIINPPSKVALAADKLAFFYAMRGAENPIVPKFWTDANQIPDDQFPIVCRTVLNGHSGAGIVIAHNRYQLVPAPLYVKYIKKKSEYRVHVGTTKSNGPTIIAVQRKARCREVPDEDVNWMIRNLDNGFVFVRNNFDTPRKVLRLAVQAVTIIGLDFGAVDVIWHEKKRQAYVLEVNTAPGMEGQTVRDYANYFTMREGDNNE